MTQVSQQDQQNRIYRAIEYMENHLQESMLLEDLAVVAGFSPFYFHRIFTCWMEESPIQYLNRLRLERAVNLIKKNPMLNLTNIAGFCGYSSVSVFSRSFKQKYGISPRTYRNELTSLSADPLQPIDAISMENMAAYQRGVEILEMPSFNVLAVPTMQGYQLDSICSAWDTLFTWTQARQLWHADIWRLGISFDDPKITPLGKCRYYAACRLEKPVKATGNLSIFTIPEGKYILCHFHLTVDKIQAAYHWVFHKIMLDAQVQYRGGMVYERYLSPSETPADQPMRLTIAIPIEDLR